MPRGNATLSADASIRANLLRAWDNNFTIMMEYKIKGIGLDRFYSAVNETAGSLGLTAETEYLAQIKVSKPYCINLFGCEIGTPFDSLSLYVQGEVNHGGKVDRFGVYGKSPTAEEFAEKLMAELNEESLAA